MAEPITTPREDQQGARSADHIGGGPHASFPGADPVDSAPAQQTLEQFPEQKPRPVSRDSAPIELPGVERLLMSALPVTSGEQVLRDVLSSWGDVCGMSDGWLAWPDGLARQGQVLAWSSSGTIHQETIPGCFDLSTIAAEIERRHPQTHECWIRLSQEDEPIAIISAPNESDLQAVPDAWIATMSALIATGLHWEQRLTEMKIEALAEYAAGAGHEINNPLGTITGRVAQLLPDETDPERRRMLELIGAQAYRVRDMIGDSMVFARPPEPHLERLNLTEELERVFDRFAARFRERHISLWGNREPNVAVSADQTQLSIVISELLRNVLAAVPDGGRVEIDCLVHMRNGQTGASLRVADDGPGLTEHEQAHCFDPFFSGRDSGRGLGFGLSKCWRIISQHGGNIDIQRSPLDLTEVYVWMPA